MTNLPSRGVVAFDRGVLDLLNGSTGYAFLARLKPPSNAAVAPEHGNGLGDALNNISTDLAPQSEKMKGGLDEVTAVAAVRKFVIGTNPSVGEKLRILSGAVMSIYTFIAHGDTPDPGEIALGTDANGTATAIASILTTDKDDIGIQSAAASTNNVTITGLANGTALRLQGIGGKVTVELTTEPLVATTANKSFLYYTVEGNLLGGTYTEFVIPITRDSKTEDIHVQVCVPYDDYTPANWYALIQSVFLNVINGVDPGDNFDGQSYEAIPHRAFSATNNKTTAANIATMLQDYFVAATSFTSTASYFKFEAGATGVKGNNIAIEVASLISTPGPIFDVKKNVPQIDGKLKYLGIYDDPALKLNNQVLKFIGSNARGTLAQLPGDANITFSIKLQSTADAEILSALSAATNRTYNSYQDLLTLGDSFATDEFALILVIKSKIPGLVNIIWLYNCTPEGDIDLNAALRNNAGYTLTVTPNADLERADSRGLVAFARKLAA